MELPAKVALYVSKPEFLRWQDNPEEPRDWAGVLKFLGLSGPDAFVKPEDRLSQIRHTIQAAIDWCITQDVDYLVHDRNFGNPIRVSDLSCMLDFLTALTCRFPENFGKRF
jgi:hypothetical protein